MLFIRQFVVHLVLENHQIFDRKIFIKYTKSPRLKPWAQFNYQLDFFRFSNVKTYFVVFLCCSAIFDISADNSGLRLNFENSS